MLNMTAGNPLKLILVFVLPILIGMFFQQLYAISDIVLIGHLLGIRSVAAVGAIMVVFVVMISLIIGFSNGLTIVTAQRFGSNDEDGVRRSFATGLSLSVIMSIVATTLLVADVPYILTLMNIPPELMPESTAFITLIGWGLTATVFYNYLSSIMRALGDSKTPLYFLIFALFLNIILNFFFISFVGMGVAGSALGTIVAQIISAVICGFWLWYKFPILRLKRASWKISKEDIKDHLRLSVPMGLQFFILSIGVVIVQRAANAMGADIIAGFTAASRIEAIFFVPMISLGIALATYSAQNFGAKKISRIRKGVYVCSMLSLCISILLALIVFLWGGELAALMMKGATPKVIATAEVYLQITTLFYPILGQIFIYRQTEQGMGYAALPFIACVAELFTRVFAAEYLGAKYGFIGLVYNGPISWIAACAIVMVGYYVIIRKFRDGRCPKHFKDNLPYRPDAVDVP